MASEFESIELSADWYFRQAGDGEESVWMPVAAVPTNVHLDLMANGKYVSKLPAPEVVTSLKAKENII